MNRTQIATLIGISLMPLAADGPDVRAVPMHGSDVLGKPGATVELRVGMAPDANGRPIAGESVEYFLHAVGGRELAELVRIGAAETDAAGRATYEWSPTAWPDARHYGIAARLVQPDRVAQARIQVFVPPPDQPLLLVKLDAQPRESSDPPTASSPAVSGSEVLEELAELYQVVYVSAVELRAAPAFRAWIERRRLPAGPLLLVEDDERTAERVRELVRTHPRTSIGIGATAADARAFADNGLAAIVVPHSLDRVGELPPDALATTSWTKVYAHARLCQMSAELLKRFTEGGAGAHEARSSLDQLGRAGVACLDRVRDAPDLRVAAIYMSGRLRGSDGFADAIDWSTAESLRDSLLAAWRYGEPSVVRRLYADAQAADADPLPDYERWAMLDAPRELDDGSVVYVIGLTAAGGTESVQEVTCVQQPDSTWRVRRVVATAD